MYLGHNLGSFHKWKNANQILEICDAYVYPRPFVKEPLEEYQNHPKIHHVEAPIMEISATMIRKRIQEEKSIQYLVPDVVRAQIIARKYYL